jgi:hypothetical protein
MFTSDSENSSRPWAFWGILTAVTLGVIYFLVSYAMRENASNSQAQLASAVEEVKSIASDPDIKLADTLTTKLKQLDTASLSEFGNKLTPTSLTNNAAIAEAKQAVSTVRGNYLQAQSSIKDDIEVGCPQSNPSSTDAPTANPACEKIRDDTADYFRVSFAWLDLQAKQLKFLESLLSGHRYTSQDGQLAFNNHADTVAFNANADKLLSLAQDQQAASSKINFDLRELTLR